MRKKTYAVVDIDGTIADVRGRTKKASQHHRPYTPAWWDALFTPAWVLEDKVIDDTPGRLRKLAETHRIAYVSGRRTTTYDATRQWLNKHGFPPGDIILRPKGIAKLDFKRAKIGELNRRIGVDICISDDPEETQLCRMMGIPKVKTVRTNEGWD